MISLVAGSNPRYRLLIGITLIAISRPPSKWSRSLTCPESAMLVRLGTVTRQWLDANLARVVERGGVRAAESGELIQGLSARPSPCSPMRHTRSLPTGSATAATSPL